MGLHVIGVGMILVLEWKKSMSCIFRCSAIISHHLSITFTFHVCICTLSNIMFLLVFKMCCSEWCVMQCLVVG